jgi:hypothetical protein
MLNRSPHDFTPIAVVIRRNCPTEVFKIGLRFRARGCTEWPSASATQISTFRNSHPRESDLFGVTRRERALQVALDAQPQSTA